MSDTSNLFRIVKLFSETFSPSTSAEDADFLFTSNEILYAVTDLDNSISKNELQTFFQIMTELGFKYKPVAKDNELKFVWLLKSSVPEENQV